LHIRHFSAHKNSRRKCGRNFLIVVIMNLSAVHIFTLHAEYLHGADNRASDSICRISVQHHAVIDDTAAAYLGKQAQQHAASISTTVNSIAMVFFMVLTSKMIICFHLSEMRKANKKSLY
jgi:hypothetical protein